MMFMKYAIALASFATAAFAQSIALPNPPEGTTVQAGQTFVLEIARPNTLSPSQEISVAIGLLSCSVAPNDNCANIDVSQRFGTILYAGPYTPSLQTPVPPLNLDFYQNFTLTVPADFATGPASVNVAHFNLIGAGPFPNLEVKNLTINIAAAA